MQTMQIPRCSDAEIEEDLNSSLELLHTEYVELYFLHRDDPRRPAGEIVEFLEKQVKADVYKRQVKALLELTGERASEAVVDQVFHRFCVGK